MVGDSAPSRWRSNLIVIVGIILAVLMALLMSSLDTLQKRLLPTSVAKVTATIADSTVVSMPVIQSSATVTSSPSPTRNLRLKPTAVAVAVLPTCGDVPDDWVTYAVQPGDTLFFLSLNSGATIDEIVQVNCLELNRLISGITIYLPSTPPVRVPCGPSPAWVPYIVQRHDTLFSLARSHGTTVYEVMQANCLTSTYLVAGRELLLPPLPATATPTSPPPPPPPRPQPSPTRPVAATPTNTATASPTFSPSATVPPSSTATPTPTHTPSPTATPVCLTPLPTGCQATLPARPSPTSLGITAGWISLGLIIGVVLALENPAWRRKP